MKGLLPTVSAALCVWLLARPPQAPVRGSDDALLLPPLELLRPLAMPWPGLVADYYWLLQCNQIGRASTVQEHRDIAAYADLATDLDPGLYHAYRLGGIATVFNLGREQFMNIDLSTRLVEKGLRHFPRDVPLRFLAGYNLGVLRRDAQAAAKVFGELAREPNVPSYVGALATRLYSEAGMFDAGMAMAQALRELAPDEESRAFYDRRVLELAAERVLREVDRASTRHAERTGAPPASVQALVDSGDLPSLPFDPLGGDVVLDASGRAQSTVTGFRLRVIRQSLKNQGLQP